MTADEFVTAVSAGGTVEVDSDIDFNDISMGGIRIPSNTVINGNGHNLTNIQQSVSSLTVFSLNGNVTFNNCNFRNVNLPTGFLFYNTATARNYFYGCEFAGYIYCLSYGNGSSYYDVCEFHKCSFNVNRFSEIRGYIYDSYVIINNNLVKSTGNFNQYYVGYEVNNTYIKGSLSITGDILFSSRLINCCFNVDITGNYSVIFSYASLIISVYNTDKIEGTVVNNANTYLKGATDEQMHDPQALFDLGFNIYVPEG